MALDWFTLVAQIVNFLVLVALLKHFFYDRIVGAMKAREANISGRLEDAARQRASAEQQAALLRAKNHELEERREQMLARAEKEAEAHRQQLMDAARLEIEKAQAQWLETLERERQGLLQDFRERLVREIFALIRHGLKELANADLEEQILTVFVERVRNLDPAERETIVAALRGSKREVEIRSAFPIRPEAQETLTRSLRQSLDDGVEVRFTTAPDLACGIEARVHSHRLAWNLDSYLENLEARVFESLDESARKHAQLP